MGRVGFRAAIASALALTIATAAPLFASERAPSARGAPSGDSARGQQIRQANYSVRQTSDHAARILAMHNAERRRLRVPDLVWNPHLEREAAEWANHLSRSGVLQHADDRTRNGTGENLWMGTSGGWDVDGMVGMFLDERRHYRHATFPDVSNTGNWADVGHYTQIVWRDTREVGCAVASARGNDVLVCRYFPAGNVSGRRAH